MLSHRLRLASVSEAGKDYPQPKPCCREAVANDDEQASGTPGIGLILYTHMELQNKPSKQLQEFISKDPKAYGLQFAYAGERERAGQAQEAIKPIEQ